MNLQTLIDSRLWQAIGSRYEGGDYTGAILDATHFLSDMLRDKAGVGGDGVVLVGQALGGKSPLLRINKLQSESDKSIQSGIEQLLRGIYQAIRNPRSHEKYNDGKADADAIVYFLDYIIRIIDKSKTPFTRADFLARVFDDGFVEDDRYATLLVKEIPGKQRFDVFIEAYQKREDGKGHKLKYFFHALYKRLSRDEKAQVCQLVSQELKSVESDSAVRTAIQVMPENCWEKYDESARFRVESRLISSIKEGRYDSATQKCPHGALGTWATHICKHFRLKAEMLSALTAKLESSDLREQDYVFAYFVSCLTEMAPDPSKRLQKAILKGLNSGDTRFRDAIVNAVFDSFGNEGWEKAFRTAYDGFTEAGPAIQAPPDDNIPF
jgi:uncharacterized protein (TIGR02391 family)